MAAARRRGAPLVLVILTSGTLALFRLLSTSRSAATAMLSSSKVVAAAKAKAKAKVSGSAANDTLAAAAHHSSGPNEAQKTTTNIIATANNMRTIPGCELVIAHYTENLTWVADLCPYCSITIYHKGGWDDSSSKILAQVGNRSKLGSGGDSVSVITLPNRGREGETWLQHVVRRYDSLAENTVLVQGALHLVRFPTRIEGVSRADIEEACHLGVGTGVANRHPGVRPLGNFVRTLHLSKGYVERYAPWVAPPLRRTMAELWGPNYQPAKLKFHASAQMALSPDAIRFHPRTSYQLLLERLWEGNERKDHEYSGYVLERLWHVLFDGQHGMTIDAP